MSRDTAHTASLWPIVPFHSYSESIDEFLFVETENVWNKNLCAPHEGRMTPKGERGE